MKLEVKDAKWFFEQLSDPDERGCMEWTKSRRANGYGQIMWRSRNTSTHRLSYKLAFGPIPEGLLVMHSCDNRACCNPMHLSCGTYRDNSHDMMAKGRGAGQATPGCVSNNRKLGPDKKREVREMLSMGIKGVDIARLFGVSDSLISLIKRGRA